MDKEIRLKLIEIARLKTTWTYTQLNEQLMLGFNFSNESDRKAIGDLIGDVSIYEHEHKRPLLSALITHKLGKREQGDGFYKLCSDLFGKDWQILKANKKWENEMIVDCFTFWLNPDNFKKYRHI